MTRHVLLLDLKDDPQLIAAYRRWHAPGGPPAAVIGAIRAAGIAGLEIHQLQDRLVMILEAGEGFSFAAKAAADAADADVQAWEMLMSRFQQPLAGSAPGEKWRLAEKIFDLGEH